MLPSRLMVIQSRVLIGAAQVPVDSLDSTAFDSCLDFLFVFFFFICLGGLGFVFYPFGKIPKLLVPANSACIQMLLLNENVCAVATLERRSQQHYLGKGLCEVVLAGLR